MKKKQELISIRKDVFMTLMNLLALSSHAIADEANAIFRDCDLGKDKQFQGQNFSHERNYNRIIDKLKKLFDMNRLVLDAIPSDDISITECVEDIAKNRKFKKLLRYYGADLASNGNFDMI